MLKRKLGQGFEVSALSLGAMGYGNARDIPDRPQMIALLRQAVDLGMDFFDTAEVYGPWTNELMVGEAFAGMRDKVKLATKFGWDIDQVTGAHRGGVNSRPEQIRSAVEGSLKRLGTDYIDLYQLHWTFVTSTASPPKCRWKRSPAWCSSSLPKAGCCISGFPKLAPPRSAAPMRCSR